MLSLKLNKKSWTHHKRIFVRDVSNLLYYIISLEKQEETFNQHRMAMVEFLCALKVLSKLTIIQNLFYFNSICNKSMYTSLLVV